MITTIESKFAKYFGHELLVNTLILALEEINRTANAAKHPKQTSTIKPVVVPIEHANAPIEHANVATTTSSSRCKEVGVESHARDDRLPQNLNAPTCWEDVAMEWQLDSESFSALQRLPAPTATQIVMALNSDLENPSAYVMIRCQKASQGERHDVVKDKSLSARSDRWCLQLLLDFIDEQGGTITTQDLAPLYQRHPEMNNVIGNRKLRSFCEQYPEDLTYTSSDRRWEGVAATIQRRKSTLAEQWLDQNVGSTSSQDVAPPFETLWDEPCGDGDDAATSALSESVHVQWLLEFIDEAGGSILTHDLSPLYTAHPRLHDVM